MGMIIADNSASASIHEDENTRCTGEGVAYGEPDGYCESFPTSILMRPRLTAPRILATKW